MKNITLLFLVFLLCSAPAFADLSMDDLQKMIMAKHPANPQEYKQYKQQILTRLAIEDQQRRDAAFKAALPALKAKEKAMMDAEARAEAKRQKKLGIAIKVSTSVPQPIIPPGPPTQAVPFPKGCSLFCEGWIFSYGVPPADINHAVYNKPHGKDDWAATEDEARKLADAKFKGKVK
jgi:hypothetical protein